MTRCQSSQQTAYFALRERLLGPLRYTILTQQQLCEVGRIMYGRPEALSLYGIPAPQMAVRGLRILGRTAVESTKDPHPDKIADAVAALPCSPNTVGTPIIVDLFCGSGNVSHHLSLRLGRPAYASELDPIVHAATSHNLAQVGSPLTLSAEDYGDCVRRTLSRHPDDLFVIEPPWGAAFTVAGLDLTRTTPPASEILNTILRARGGATCLVVVETSDKVANDSLRTAFHHATHLRTLAPEPLLPGIPASRFHLYRLGARSSDGGRGKPP